MIENIARVPSAGNPSSYADACNKMSFNFLTQNSLIEENYGLVRQEAWAGLARRGSVLQLLDRVLQLRCGN